MCGLLGWQFIQGDRRLSLLAAALMVQMDKRGGHAWGYYADGKVRKGIGPFSFGVPGRSLRNTLTFMGHCRLASVGSKDKVENAHPFVCGDVIGAHNGSIHNYEELNEEYDRSFEVDSQHIFAHIDENKSLKELAGYGAITWLRQSDPEKLHLCRFNNGDLAVARIEIKGKAVGTVYASTGEALSLALGAAGFTDWTNIKVEDDVQYYMKDGAIWLNPVGKIGIEWSRYKTSWENRRHSKSGKEEKEEKSKTIRPWDDKGRKPEGLLGIDVYDESVHPFSGYGSASSDIPSASQATTPAEIMALQDRKLSEMFKTHPEYFAGLAKESGIWYAHDISKVFALLGKCYFCEEIRPTTFVHDWDMRICPACYRKNQLAIESALEEEDITTKGIRLAM